MNIKAILRDIYGLIVMAIILPLPILYGLGFLFGEGVAENLPKWFEKWAVISLFGLFFLWGSEVVWKLAKKMTLTQEMSQSLAMVKEPDLDYEGMAGRIEKARNQREEDQ